MILKNHQRSSEELWERNHSKTSYKLNKLDISKKIQKVIHQNDLFIDGDTIVVGVSGGPDSIALLHILSQLQMNLRLVAVYVDHNLRPHETKAEKDLVSFLADNLNSIVFESVSIDVKSLKKELKTSTEEAARIARYDALEGIRNRYQAQVIAVGHTSDDQAEELLIRLIRGSGRSGLSGMKIKSGHIVRPLLAEPKLSLIHYLQEHKINFCHDSSNLDRSFLRNRIRLDLIPHLEEHYNPSIREILLQNSTILQSEDLLLEQLSNESYHQVVEYYPSGKQGKAIRHQSARVNIEAFKELHRAIQRRILEKICWQMAARPNFKVIEQLLKLIDNGLNGNEVHLQKGLKAVKNYSTVNFHYPAGRQSCRDRRINNPVVNKTVEQTGEYRINELNKTLTLTIADEAPENLEPTTLIVDGDLVHFPLLLRSSHKGEKFRPFGSPGKKKTSRFLSDRKVPKDRRFFYPVLLSEDHIIALVGQEIEDQFQLTAATSKFLIIKWIESNE